MIDVPPKMVIQMPYHQKKELEIDESSGELMWASILHKEHYHIPLYDVNINTIGIKW